MSSHPSAERHAADPDPGARVLEPSPLDRLDTLTDLDVIALSTPLGVFRSTRDEGIVWVNRRFLEITGLTREQALGSDWLRAVHPLDRERVDAARRDIHANPRDLAIEYRIVLPDGSVRHVRVRVLPLPERPDEQRMFIGAIEEVSDLVDEPDPPTAGEDPFRSLVVASPLGVAYSDAAGRIIYLNDRWLEITGRTAEELLDSNDLRIAHPDDRVGVYESMAAAAIRGEEWFGEMRVLRPDGEVRHTRTSMAAIHDADGAATGYVATLEDVTDEARDRTRAKFALEARVAAEALVAEASRALTTASVDDVDEQIVVVLERMARFVGADAAVWRVDPRLGSAGYEWRNPESGRTVGSQDPVVGTREELGSVSLEWRAGPATMDREALEPLAVIGDALASTLARVRAEQAVRSSEERFRSLAEHSSDFMLVYGEQGHILYQSPSTARFGGFAIGTRFSDPGIVHPDDVGLVAQVFGPLRAGGRGTSSPPFEVRIRRADGEYRWLEMIATNLLEDPVVGGIVVNARDITERREAQDGLRRSNESLERTNAQLSDLVEEKLEVEQQLRASEELFRAIVQNSSDAITVIDLDGTVRFGSSLGKKVLGYEEDFPIGGALDLIHPDDKDSAADTLRRAFTEPGMQGPIRIRVQHSDGSWRHLEAFGNNLSDNPAVRGIVVAARDVTAAVEAEDALRRSDDRFRALVQNLSDVITIVGPDGRLAYSSPAAEQLFGFTEGDESWTDPMARVHPEDLERVVEAMSEHLETGDTEPISFRLRIADGSYRDVEAIAQDLTDDPSVGGIVVTTRDVSERARAESIVASQAQILRLIAQGAPLIETLGTICQVVEAGVPGALCSVMLVDEAENVLRMGAAPGLPVDYARATDRVPIGPMQGSCGSAAHHGEPVVVEDVTADDRWAEWAATATANGLRACWSTPIVRVVG